MLNKIKDNIFFKSAFLLLIGGTLTKLVGFILKIIITRKIGTEGIAIYSLLSPTISLLTVALYVSLISVAFRSVINLSYVKL